MNCEEISELLPAYVLGALEPDEVEAVEAHLREGSEHEQELLDLRATVFAMDRFGEDLAEEPAARAPLRGEASAQTAPSRGIQFAWPGGRRMAAIAAAVLVLFGAGWVAGQIITGGETYAYAIQGEDGAFMEVAGETSAGSVTVTMAGLDHLETDSYQVWAIRDGVWVSIGVCNTNAEGRWVGDFDFSLREGERVALTIEPKGGSERPTSEPLLRTDY